MIEAAKIPFFKRVLITTFFNHIFKAFGKLPDAESCQLFACAR
jgi:hypothetical protein